MTTHSATKRSTASREESLWQKRTTNYALWTIQTLLALLFLFAGGVKLVLPIEAMAQQITLPGSFLRFIGVAEALGAIGLILPGLLGIRRELTCLAASGLLVIMVGATVVTLAGGSVAGALMPFVVGVLLLFVAYGRWSTLAVASGIEGPADFVVPRSTN